MKNCQNNEKECIKPSVDNTTMLFNNLPELMKPELVANVLGLSVKTIYDWNYRQKTRNIPEGLFIKINRLLYLRTTVLRNWINSQNPCLG